MVCLKLLLMVAQSLHILRKLLLVLLGGLSGLLEFLILGFVLFKDSDKLLLLLDTLLSLLLVLLTLFLDLFSLIIDLLVKRLLNSNMLTILLIELICHKLHLFRTLLLQLFILLLQLISLLPNHLIFFLRLSNITGHLRFNGLEMFVKVLANFLSLGCFFVRDLGVAFLELTILGLVLSGDLLKPLPDCFSFTSAVLMLQRMLVKQLFISFSTSSCGIDGAQKWHEFLGEDDIQSVCALLKGHLCSIARTTLQLSDAGGKLNVELLKALRLLTILIRLTRLLHLLQIRLLIGL